MGFHNDRGAGGKMSANVRRLHTFLIIIKEIVKLYIIVFACYFYDKSDCLACLGRLSPCSSITYIQYALSSHVEIRIKNATLSSTFIMKQALNIRFNIIGSALGLRAGSASVVSWQRPWMAYVFRMGSCVERSGGYSAYGGVSANILYHYSAGSYAGTAADGHVVDNVDVGADIDVVAYQGGRFGV